MADTRSEAGTTPTRQWVLVGIMLVVAAVVGTVGPQLTGQAGGAPPADTSKVPVRLQERETNVSVLPAADALVGVWPGSFTADDLDRRFEVARVAGAKYSPGKVGTAFRGSERATIELTPTSALRLPTPTLAVWLKIAKDSRGGEVAALQVGPATNLMLRIEGPFVAERHGRAVVGIGAESLTGNVRLNDGEWHHVAVTFDGKLARLWVDGRLDAEAGRSLRLPPRTRAVLRMGAVDALVDELALYERALDQAEIIRLRRAGELGLVRAWTGDEAQPGRFSGNIGYESGRFGFGYRFGGDGHIEIARSPALHLSRFTLASWFRLPAADVPHHYALFAKENHHCGAPWSHRNYYLGVTPKFVYGGKVGLTFFAPGARIGAAADIADGKWHHAAATYDGNKLEVLVDGKVIASGEIPPPPVDDKQELWIGGFGRAASPFRARLDMDDAAIFAKALSAREISLLADPRGHRR